MFQSVVFLNVEHSDIGFLDFIYIILTNQVTDRSRDYLRMHRKKIFRKAIKRSHEKAGGGLFNQLLILNELTPYQWFCNHNLK